MVMEYMKQRLREQDIRDSATKSPPQWVNARNASLKAWECVELLKKERLLFIQTHSRLSDYKKKSHYQIKASEVARSLGISRATLMHTSSYSNNFSAHLQKVNEDLDAAKEKAVNNASKSNSRGSIRSSKDDLLIRNRELKRRINELEVEKTERLVDVALEKLPLPIRRKLGLS